MVSFNNAIQPTNITMSLSKSEEYGISAVSLNLVVVVRLKMLCNIIIIIIYSQYIQHRRNSTDNEHLLREKKTRDRVYICVIVSQCMYCIHILLSIIASGLREFFFLLDYMYLYLWMPLFCLSRNIYLFAFAGNVFELIELGHMRKVNRIHSCESHHWTKSLYSGNVMIFEYWFLS